MAYRIGDKVKVYRGEKKVNTTITGMFTRGGRKYYTVKATGKNKGYPVARLH